MNLCFQIQHVTTNEVDDEMTAADETGAEELSTTSVINNTLVDIGKTIVHKMLTDVEPTSSTGKKSRKVNIGVFDKVNWELFREIINRMKVSPKRRGKHRTFKKKLFF